MANPKPRSFLPHLVRIQGQTAFGRRVTPPFVTLYVTTRCDEQCIHCYYWDQLNPQPNRDFQLDEVQQTLASMGEIYNLFIGGGEPFLRRDLAEIFVSAARTNRVANLYVPTNGQHAARVVETLEKTLTAAPEMRFHLNLSVDHTDPAKHDRIRGRENAYRRMLDTVQAIEPFRRRFPHLIVHTLTTVMKENQAEILEIHEELQRRFRPDGASFNYCRGHPLDPAQTDVDPAKYEELMRRLEQDFARGSTGRSESSAYGPANHILDQHVRRSVERTVSEQRPQFSCVSGRLACVIYRNGDVVECEMKNSRLGNLREVGYDFPKLWFSERAQQVAREAAHGCFCTHECGHYASTIYSLPQVAKISVKAAWRRLSRPLQGRAAAKRGADPQSTQF